MLKITDLNIEEKKYNLKIYTHEQQCAFEMKGR